MSDASSPKVWLNTPPRKGLYEEQGVVPQKTATQKKTSPPFTKSHSHFPIIEFIPCGIKEPFL